MGWVTEGIKTGPLVGTQVLADTGAFGAENGGNIKVIVSSTVAIIVTFEYRNAANTATNKAQAFICPAGDTKDVEFMVACLQDERFRLTISGLVAGSVQGSLSSGMW